MLRMVFEEYESSYDKLLSKYGLVHVGDPKSQNSDYRSINPPNNTNLHPRNVQY